MRALPANFYRGLLYTAISFILWVATEYITVWHSRLQEWLSYSPWIFVQCLAVILPFSFLFFLLRASERTVAIVMFAAMVVWESLWRNPLLLNARSALPALVLLTSIWTFLTFVPFWLLAGLLTRRKVAVAFSLSWVIVGAVLRLSTIIR
jgi:hypothetical protein